MRVMRTAVERAAPLLPWARDAIGRVAHDAGWCAALRSSAEASRIFVDLCASRREVPLKSGTVMRELHDLGLLLAMIPEFSPVVGRVHHDVYHVYTVDVHSVAAVDRLAALVRGDLADEHPLACRLAAEVPRPQTLFFATLLHDVGKAIGGKDHSQRGAEMARSILTRLGFEPEDVDEAAHLILEHLSMYHVATRRDLDDPATVAEFARRMGERETLRDLYLLTVADLSTTSPTSMTSWKASMLDELYLATDAALVGEIPDGAGGPGRAARVTELVLAHAHEKTCADVRVPAGAQQRRDLEAWLPRYLASMPERYLLSNTPAAIVAHAALARDQERRTPAAGAPPVVALVPTRHPGTAEICAVATDRPGLLSAITAAIAASRLEVHAAQIHSRAMDAGGVQAVDLFWVRDRGEGEAGVARALPKLAADLQSVLSGKVDARELARRRGGSTLRDRPTPHVSTRVSIDDRASNRHTVIDVLTRDRPGLLFAIADAVYRTGLSIAVAKINTEGTRVADVFYVSEADGSKVARGARAKAVQDAVEAALASLDS
jgi:[protein-PII] uridylyltransferase